MRKNILCIESGPGLGGSAFSMYRVLKNRDTERFNFHVFTYYDAPVFDKISALGVSVEKLPLYQPFPAHLVAETSLARRSRNFIVLYGTLFIETLFNGVRLARRIRKLNIDVVHCNNGIFENFAAVFAARLTNVPCISDVKGTEPLLKIERRSSGWIRQMMVLNRFMYDHYSAVFGEDRVNLVFECIDLDSADNPQTDVIRRDLAVRRDAFVIGTFARLIEGKGIPEFIRAAAEIVRIRANAQFFIVGDAASGQVEFEQEMHTLANELGVEQHITFTGWRSDVMDIMSAMDVVIQISTTFPEGMPLAPIEAMALHKPVVVSDIAGYMDIVDDGETGYIVPAGDVEKLVNAIMRIAENAELARNLGDKGYEKVLTHFDARIRERRIEEIYDVVMQ